MNEAMRVYLSVRESVSTHQVRASPNISPVRLRVSRGSRLSGGGVPTPHTPRTAPRTHHTRHRGLQIKSLKLKQQSLFGRSGCILNAEILSLNPDDSPQQTFRQGVRLRCGYRVQPLRARAGG